MKYLHFHVYETIYKSEIECFISFVIFMYTFPPTYMYIYILEVYPKYKIVV